MKAQKAQSRDAEARQETRARAWYGAWIVVTGLIMTYFTSQIEPAFLGLLATFAGWIVIAMVGLIILARLYKW